VSKWNEIIAISAATLVSVLLALAISFFWRRIKLNRFRQELLDTIQTFKSLRREPGESVRERLQGLIRESDRLEGIDNAKKQKLKSLAHQALGLYHFELEHYDRALDCFEQAAALNPASIDAIFYKAGCLGYLSRREQDAESKNKLLQRALEASRKVVDLIPQDAYNLIALGWILDEMGSYEEAIKQYDRALAINPKLSGARYNKACALAKAGRLEDAMAILQSLTQEPMWLEEAREDEDLTTTLGHDDVLGPKFRELVSRSQADGTHQTS